MATIDRVVSGNSIQLKVRKSHKILDEVRKITSRVAHNMKKKNLSNVAKLAIGSVLVVQMKTCYKYDKSDFQSRRNARKI